MALPQRNARLTKIERTGGTAAGGYSEDYDLPATDPEAEGGEGENLWTGNVAAYYVERRERLSGDTRDLLLRRWLTVPGLHEVAEEDHVTFEIRKRIDGKLTRETVRGEVEVAERRDTPGIPPETRLTLVAA